MRIFFFVKNYHQKPYIMIRCYIYISIVSRSIKRKDLILSICLIQYTTLFIYKNGNKYIAPDKTYFVMEQREG